jgi:hypothetical protein
MLETRKQANKITGANSRPASPLDAGRQFGCASCAPPSPSAGDYRIIVTHSGGLPGNPAPSTQKVSVVMGGVTPPAPVITALEKSPTANEFLLTFTADPGAYITILTSTNVAAPLTNWTVAGSVLAESVTNTVQLTSSAEYRFWALRRGQ